ncbi:cytochrome P450, partial [Mycena galericulata]
IIPEGTAVQVPPYTIHRDSRYFSPNPDSFMPERWLAEDDDPNFVLNNNAYIPFSTGPANCIGKNIALLELRVVVAYLMQTFEMSFAEGYDARRWEADLKDHFTL